MRRLLPIFHLLYNHTRQRNSAFFVGLIAIEFRGSFNLEATIHNDEPFSSDGFAVVVTVRIECFGRKVYSMSAHLLGFEILADITAFLTMHTALLI